MEIYLICVVAAAIALVLALAYDTWSKSTLRFRYYQWRLMEKMKRWRRSSTPLPIL